MNRIVATSPNYLATSSVLRRYEDKVSVIPIGLNKASYAESDEACLSYWRQRFGQRFFLFIGMMRYYKGLHILLDALKNTAYPVVLVGTGPIEAALKAKAKADQLHHVHFLGALSDVDKVALLTLCGCLVFPSHLRSEAFGVSLLEGAMFGKPMISAEIGTGTSYINLNGKTGIVVPPNDAFALRHAMSFIWNNPTHAEAMGKEAQTRYNEVFTGQRMVSQYEQLYEDVLCH